MFLIRKNKKGIYFSWGFQPRWLKFCGSRTLNPGGQPWLSAVTLAPCDPFAFWETQILWPPGPPCRQCPGPFIHSANRGRHQWGPYITLLMAVCCSGGIRWKDAHGLQEPLEEDKIESCMLTLAPSGMGRAISVPSHFPFPLVIMVQAGNAQASPPELRTGGTLLSYYFIQPLMHAE